MNGGAGSYAVLFRPDDRCSAINDRGHKKAADFAPSFDGSTPSEKNLWKFLKPLWSNALKWPKTSRTQYFLSFLKPVWSDG
jgi:hypothetical protein